MKRPLSLKKGDTVGLLSTARKISKEEITHAARILNQWELKPRLGATIGTEDHQFAGTDLQRTEDFQSMLDDPEVKAIWCARGGYGTVRIIDQLDFSKYLERPKWIIGYSDITVLHSHLNLLGVNTLHATMPIDVQNDSEEALRTLKCVLFGRIPSIETSPSVYNKLGKARGALIGGNLSILYSLLGSNSSLDTKGRILFIEDLDEYLYHIDRMMMNLRRNGYFDALAGLVVGTLTKMHDNTIPFGKNAQEIVLDRVRDLDFPVCFDFPAGHLDDNRALVFGHGYVLNVGVDGVSLDAVP